MKFKADTPNPTDLKINYRSGIDGSVWTKWKEVWSEKESVQEGGRDDGVGVVLNKKGAYTYSELMFPDRNSGETNLIQFEIILNTTDLDISPSLDEVIIEAINTLEENDSEISEVQAATAPNVISRAGWGANESWMTWTPQYYDVENFYVHHTVSMNNDPNPPATVRAIYYYHAISRGWGDIGYNYLIDAQGRIYEGRKGGNRVIGGHVLGYNVGSIGVSLLGDFHPGSVARGNGPSYLTTAAKNSLEDLVAWRGYDNKVNPLGTWIAGGAYPGVKNNVAGHRDSGATSCPGDYLYSALGSIRKDAYAKYLEFKPPYRLVREADNPQVYLLVEGEEIIRPIVSPTVFYAWNFKWSQVEEINLSGYEQGSTLTELARDYLNKVYLLDSGIKYFIPNPEVLNDWNLGSKTISNLPDNFLSYYSLSYQSLSSVVREKDTSKIYLIDSGQSWHIRNPLSFAQWELNSGNIQTLPVSVLGKLSYGGQLSYLVKKSDDPRVYLVDSGNKIHLKSLDTFYAWGFKWDDITTISQNLVDSLDSVTGSLGYLAKKESDNKVYLLNYKVKYFVPNPTVFYDWGWDWDQVVALSDSFLSNYFESSNLSTLIKVSGTRAVYMVDSGDSWHVRNPATLEAWGLDLSQLKTVPSSVNELLNQKGFISNLVKTPDQPHVYLIVDQVLHHIPSIEILKALGLSWSDLAVLPIDLIQNYTTSGDPVFSTVKAIDESIVYVLADNKKYQVINPTTFYAWGLNWDKVTEIEKSTLDSISYGGLVPTSDKIVKATSSDTFYIKDSLNVQISQVAKDNTARTAY
ncbi:MAG: N-acetylmuramoyl-L-alanine amidase, partial [bacterium]